MVEQKQHLRIQQKKYSRSHLRFYLRTKPSGRPFAYAPLPPCSVPHTANASRNEALFFGKFRKTISRHPANAKFASSYSAWLNMFCIIAFVSNDISGWCGHFFVLLLDRNVRVWSWGGTKRFRNMQPRGGVARLCVEKRSSRAFEWIIAWNVDACMYLREKSSPDSPANNKTSYKAANRMEYTRTSGKRSKTKHSLWTRKKGEQTGHLGDFCALISVTFCIWWTFGPVRRWIC